MVYFRNNTAPGGFYFTSNVQPLIEDTVPDSFTFMELTGEAVGAISTSNLVTVAGINGESPISVTGGTFSVNGGSFTSTPSTVVTGDRIRARLVNSELNFTTKSAIVTIGGVSGAFQVTTSKAADGTVPSQFTTPDQAAVPPNTEIVSSGIVLAGFTEPSPVSISAGAEYRITDTGDWISTGGVISPGEELYIRITTPSGSSQISNILVTVGGVSDIWTVSTAGAGDTSQYSVSPIQEIKGDWHLKDVSLKLNELIDNINILMGDQGISKVNPHGDFILENAVGKIDQIQSILGLDFEEYYPRIADPRMIGSNALINKMIKRANELIFV